MTRTNDTPSPAAPELIVGTHVATRRTGYVHHGIYAGDGSVVHYAGWCGELRRGPVQQVTLTDFARGRQFWIVRRCAARYSGEEVLERALSRLGEDCYCLTTNNCEHFCTWCVSGQAFSDQVDRWFGWPRRMLIAVVGVVRPLFDGLPQGSTAAMLGAAD